MNITTKGATTMGVTQEKYEVIRKELATQVIDTDRIEALVYDARRDYQDVAERLATQANHLADDMQRLALKAQKAAQFGRHTINDLGEVQSRGATVDRLCALLGERSKMLGNLEGTLGIDTVELNRQFGEIEARS